jgi:WD40 repeat protein/uncharacterized caspase-like protein
MTNPRACLLASALLSAFFIAQSGAPRVVASTQKPARARPHSEASQGATKKTTTRRTGASKTTQARASKTTQASASKTTQARASTRQPLRLVVQQGLRTIAHGFTLFSPDGRLVATGDGNSGDVVLWEVASGREVRRLTENSGDPGAQDVDGWLWGAFSPDGRLLATSVGPNLRLWDLTTGRRLWVATNEANAFFVPDDGAHPPVTFAAGGAQIVVTGTEYKLTWEARTGRLLSRARLPHTLDKLESYDMRPPRDAVSPNGRFAAHAKDGLVTVTEKATGKRVGGARFLVLKPGRISSMPGQVWHDELWAVAVSPDGRTLATADEGDQDADASDNSNGTQLIRLWDVKTGAQLRRLTGAYGDSSRFRFTPAGGLLGVSSRRGDYGARDMLSGKGVAWRAAAPFVMHESISPDARFVATSAGLAGEVWDTQTGERVARVEGRLDPGEDPKYAGWNFAGFTPLDTVTFYRDSRHGEPQTVTLSTRDWKETKPPVELPLTNEERSFVMSPDSRVAAWEFTEEGDTPVQRVNVWRAAEPTRVRSFPVTRDEAYGDASLLSLSPDGERLLVATANNGGSLRQMLIKVYHVGAGSPESTLKRPGFRVSSFAWSPDARLVATGAGSGPGERATIWDVSTGEAIRKLDGPKDEIEEFSPDGRLLLTSGLDGFERVYEVATGRELCRFITRADGSWVVVDPEGRFDASDLEEIQGVHWLAPEDPLRPVPLEIFMRDYYEPRLLARILAGERLAPVRALSEVDRAQPFVSITSVEQLKGRPEFARVTVEVSRPAAGGSGVYDLRLFRGGQLAAYAPTEGGELKTDARTGKATVTFDNVRLPRPRAADRDDNDEGGASVEAGVVEFTAYAFNEDRVKSLTARASFVPPEPLPATKGRAYVVSVGVNAYENEAWDLRFAANDARRLQSAVAARLAAGGEYEEVVSVPLISDYASDGGRKASPRVVKESSATKANFRAVLDALAGKEVEASALKSIPNASALRRATPEDLVVISFSSHGYADERGNFFLLPYDTGQASELRDAMPRAISSDELSLWLRDVDAGELVLVVDACHSAASVRGGGFKPGPMGSRGLGQLSYDKGMRILASTQAEEIALESALVEQGLLTYALTRDGLDEARADFRPKDSRITIAEWLAYGVERVPGLHAEVERKLAELRAGRADEGARSLGDDAQARVVVTKGSADGAKGIKISGQPARSQQPALFDFARRRRDAVLATTK